MQGKFPENIKFPIVPNSEFERRKKIVSANITVPVNNFGK
jgi:hypothetical protein